MKTTLRPPAQLWIKWADYGHYLEQLEKAINQLDKAGTSTSTDPENQLTDERSDAEQSGSEDTDMAV